MMELMASAEAVTASQVRDAFERMLACRASVAIAGKLGKGANDRFLELFATRQEIKGLASLPSP